MKKLTIYLDREYLKVGPKVVEGFTPGVFKAEGVFETMLAIGDKVLDAPVHLRRLRAAFKGVTISPQVLAQIVKANGFKISRLRIVAWKKDGQKHVAVMALKYESPVERIFKLCLVKTSRQASSRLAHVKSLDYKIFADAYHKAKKGGYDDALLTNKKGHVFEASRANVFIVKNGKFLTPPLSSGCLNGITRQEVIRQAQKLGIVVIEKNLTVSDIHRADTAFLTNSLLGIRPFRLA